MTAHLRGSRLRRAASAASVAVLAAGMLSLAACNVTEFLQVDTPDVILPDDIRSPAGADALRTGAIARLNAATSGGSSSSEGLFLLSGLFADEWNNGDSFIARQEVDQRAITPQNSFLTDVNRMLHRARLTSSQAIDMLREFKPTGPAADVAEMYFVQAYAENVIGEHYCNGVVFSTVVNGVEQYGTPVTTQAAFEMALAHADSGLALITGSTAADVRVRSALRVLRGRILINLNRPADAATAVAGVPTSYRYNMRHSESTRDNAIWNYNNLVRRYSVSTLEGTNGLNFATANDPRVPVCTGGDATCKAIGVTSTKRDDDTSPLYVQRIWPTRSDSVTIAGGIEAQLIIAEAQLKGASAGDWLATLNALRTDGTFKVDTITGDTLWQAGTGRVDGLRPLTDPGSADARVNLLFRERAFWLFGRGHRVGDMRRLIRQYGRPANTVFPTGNWHKGGQYGGDVNFPIPQAELNNPNAGQGCIDRNA